jgi:hypothetical protein
MEYKKRYNIEHQQTFSFSKTSFSQSSDMLNIAQGLEKFVVISRFDCHSLHCYW